MSSPEIALIISTFQRPLHLQRALLTIAAQRGVEGKIEVVVTDDGSTDETRQVVEGFARNVDFRVSLITHTHRGFRLARCRNEGTAASVAPYLLFTDGDCLLPPDHIAKHLMFRRPGTVVVGDCYRLDRKLSEQIDESVAFSGDYLQSIPSAEKRRIANKARRAQWYQLICHPMLPRMTGNNIGIWRHDLENVNGFDENFVGWGLEDRDLQRRLSRSGLRFRSILKHTVACHLWHPNHPTFARNNKGTANLQYYQRKDISTYCANGLVKRVRENVVVQVIDSGGPWSEHEKGAVNRLVSTVAQGDVEVLALPGEGRFSGDADCRVLLVRENCSAVQAAMRRAHIAIFRSGNSDGVKLLPFPAIEVAPTMKKAA